MEQVLPVVTDIAQRFLNRGFSRALLHHTSARICLELGSVYYQKWRETTREMDVCVLATVIAAVDVGYRSYSCSECGV